ncbi:Transcription initiation factor IIA subunit 2 [Lithohypha guttulata]|nr:Transcription initiation factor IIA subunit 2 [Lithohypha guttulata]
MSSRKKQTNKTKPAEEARYIKREEDTDSDPLIKDEESTEASGDQPEADSSNLDAPPAPNPDHVFRLSTLGSTFVDALDEMVESNTIPPELARKMLEHFDTKIAGVLADRDLVKGQITFKGTMDQYKHLDEMWKIQARDVRMKVNGSRLELDRLNLLARPRK